MDAPLAFDPGTRWAYGISTDILGILVEAVSKQSLDAYMSEHIFTPLDMLDTGFSVPASKQERVVTAFARSADGSLQAIPQDLSPPAFFAGGGGLFSTARDYSRFLRAILRSGELDGRRILLAATIDLMATNQIGQLEAADGLVTTQPALSNDFSFFPDSRDSFGLGFLINQKAVAGGRSAGSLAWAGLYNTYFWVDRDRDVCGVLMTQQLPFFDSAVVKLLNEFETAIYLGVEAD